MKNILIATCLAFATLGLSSAANAGPNARIAKNISAVWDMTGRIKGIHVLVSVRQEGNMYAGIYGGVNSAGKFTIAAQEDSLTDELKIKSTGGFTLRFTNIPPRQGMDHLVPGQIWFKGIGGKNNPKTATIEFTEFTNWKQVKDDKRNDTEIHRLSADFKAVFKAGDTSANIKGTANFSIPAKIQTFQFDANTVFNAEELGSEAPIKGPVSVRIRTKSPASQDKPVQPHERMDFKIE